MYNRARRKIAARDEASPPNPARQLAGASPPNAFVSSDCHTASNDSIESDATDASLSRCSRR
jgi:hypothetical protein